MGNFEQDLCTTVDAILEALGYEPNIVRSQYQDPTGSLLQAKRPSREEGPRDGAALNMQSDLAPTLCVYSDPPLIVP